jgi:hypothetical protein
VIGARVEAREIRAYLVTVGGSATTREVCERFDLTDGTLRRRRCELLAFGVDYHRRGARSGYEIAPIRGAS